MTADEFSKTLDQVFARIRAEAWFSRAKNYVVIVNEDEQPRHGNGIVLATTRRGGGVPTQITYYLSNIRDFSVDEIYRITRHEFAHLWGLDEHDAQVVERGS